MEHEVIDMAGITKKELSARRQRLLAELPNHGWDYVKAGIAAGYSPSYARARLKKYATKDSTFCQQVTAKRCEIEATTQDLREKALQKLITTLERPNLRPSEIARLVEVMGKMNGWMSETRVLETSERRRELTQAEREEAQKLAILRFSPQYAQETLTPHEPLDAPFPESLRTLPEKILGQKIFEAAKTEISVR